MSARIFQKIKSSTSSGKGNMDAWLLEFERSEPDRHDPLTGWAGSGDTQRQVRLTFSSLEAAKAYAEREGIDAHVVPSPPSKLKIQTYADNFR